MAYAEGLATGLGDVAFEGRRGPSWYAGQPKRALDLALVLVVAPMCLLVVALLALLVALDGRKPFYSQPRVGQGGRIFTLWKLRTMCVDADAVLASHLEADPSVRTEWDLHQKLKDDPRVTPIGRVLRRTSLDELPQLWNVLCGDMSLVGPRPMMPSQLPLYPGQSYFELRPGLTGPWQVSERSSTSFAARSSFDDRYLRELSLETDLRLLWRTVSVVLRGTGC